MHKDLLQLAQLDKQKTILEVENEDSAKERAALAERIKGEKLKVARLQQQLAVLSDRLKSEESRLRDEEHHIENRRKQVSAMTGAAQAKILEREIDVSRRALETLETAALKAMEAKDQQQLLYDQQLEKLNNLELDAGSKSEALLAKERERNDRIAQLVSSRSELVARLKSDLLRKYDRIRTKFPAEPVAILDGEHCKSCFRSLPTNIIQSVQNSVRGEVDIQQCPGCFRLLVDGAIIDAREAAEV